MAQPRIFISSTYYDLKHIRSSIDNFIESLGFESVLSEKGNIAYSPDAPLDESCYREAMTADILVIVIGGRYGSAASTEDKKPGKKFYERFDSITRKEYESAADRDIPTYIMIEANVYSEYQTFLRNKKNKQIEYAHVDSVNIFLLIEEILAKPRNNPIQTFERFSDIESWLREQWAGLFRELLHRMSGNQQIATLSAQVDALSAINETLQRYLEVVVTKISPDDAGPLIATEQKRLNDIEINDRLKHNRFFIGALSTTDVTVEMYRTALENTESFIEFAKMIEKNTGYNNSEESILEYNAAVPIRDINDAREILNKSPFEVPEEES